MKTRPIVGRSPIWVAVSAWCLVALYVREEVKRSFPGQKTILYARLFCKLQNRGLCPGLVNRELIGVRFRKIRAHSRSWHSSSIPRFTKVSHESFGVVLLHSFMSHFLMCSAWKAATSDRE